MVGIYGDKKLHSAGLAYLCLYALQHRGQEGSGIASYDGTMHLHKGIGLVSDIYIDGSLQNLPGNISIGNNKYSTSKDRFERNILPMVVDLSFGQLAISFSGALFSDGIRKNLVNSGAIFTTSSDSEVMLHLIAKKCSYMQLEDAIINSCKEVKGAYAMLLMTADKLIAIRDPYGIKPLILGKVDGAYVLVSETAALDLIGAEFIRDVDPGEMIIIDEQGVETYSKFGADNNPCIFEYVYISRPDSVIYNNSVYLVRVDCGKRLADIAPVDADLVIPVPDSGIASAIGYSHASGIPFELGIVRNHYVGRTFIKPTQEIRNFSVKVKLNPISHIIKGKRLVVVDDSIVRGNTCRQIVNMLKEAGAREVHLRIASPQVKYPCFYGIDTPEAKDLVANNYNLKGMRDMLGADSIAFLDLEGLNSTVNGCKYCDACFSGRYPVLE